MNVQKHKKLLLHIRRISFVVSILVMCWIVVDNPFFADTASQCPSNATPALQASDPACWTSASTTTTEICTWKKVGYSCAVVNKDGSWEPVYTVRDKNKSCPYNSTKLTKCPDGVSRSYCHGDVYENNCGGTHCTNDGNPSDYTKSTKAITHTCYYTTVKSWSTCNVDTGTQYAMAIEQHETPGTNCDNLNEALTQSCGVCTPGTNIDVTQMPSTTGICAHGKPTTPQLVNDRWVWQCKGSNDNIASDDASCSVPNKAPGICNPSLDGMVLTNKPEETDMLCTSGQYQVGSLSGTDIGPWTWICDPIGEESDDICNATCLKLSLDAPEFVYLKEEDNVITAKIRVEGYDNITASTECTVNNDESVIFSSHNGVSEPFTVDVTGGNTTISVTCDISGPCNSDADNSVDYTVSADVGSMCVSRSCNSQGTCQAVPQSASNVSDCKSTCNSDADCSTGRMIETRP